MESFICVQYEFNNISLFSNLAFYITYDIYM